MRDFNEADKNKKKVRIQIPENPGNLSKEALSELEDRVKSSLQNGYLSCVSAFKIAEKFGAPEIAVGAMADRLGIRISDCRIGCFKVDKIIHNNASGQKIDEKIVAGLESLKEKDGLTCENVFALAGQMKTTPMAIAEVADAQNWKIYHCRLGCF